MSTEELSDDGQDDPPVLPVSAAQRRIEILNAAAEVFGEHGYGKGSLAEIGDRVGITRAGVLHHFGSKEDLLIALLGHFDRLEKAEQELYPPGHALNVADYLAKAATHGTEQLGIMRSYAVLLANSATEGNPTTPFFSERILRRRAELAEALKNELKPVEVTDEEADRVACAILSFLDGLRMQWLLEANVEDPSEIVRGTVNALIDDLR